MSEIYPETQAEWPAGAKVTPIGYQGPAAHTYTPGCAGHHPPSQPCPPAAAQPAVNGMAGWSVTEAEYNDRRAAAAAELARVTAERDLLREQLRQAKLGLLSITLSVDDSPGALMRTAQHALDQVKAADPNAPKDVKPVVIVFDINEGIQGWFHDLTQAVYDQSGERVVITEIDADMSDVMITVADRAISTDEAIAIWHAAAGDPQ